MLAIIDWVVKQPATQFPHSSTDPLLGMVGGSYGGGIQWGPRCRRAVS